MRISCTLLGVFAIVATTALALPNSKLRSAPGLVLDSFGGSSSSHSSVKRNKHADILNPRQNSSITFSDAGVKLCTGPQFKGECYHAVWPINECIDLRGFAGVTKSFLPDAGFECLITQGKCDATVPFREIGSDDGKEGADLSDIEWITELKSYMCFTEIESLRRFVRAARMRVATGARVEAT